MARLLNDIIQALDIRKCVGDRDVSVGSLILDSRQAESGCLFFAVKGTTSDGHEYIDDVIERGAAVIVCERLPDHISGQVCYLVVDQVAPTIGLVAAAFYGHPTKEMQVIGVTGTNGKTTVTTLLFRLFRALGYHCGLISTVQNQIDDQVLQATHTTPDPISLQALFSQMKDAGCRVAFMEVSSHALVQHRTAGTDFAGGVFTNITHDHLDYHKTFDAYIKAKKSFFDRLPKTAFALSNRDDKRGEVMLQNCPANRKFYALRNPADFKGKVLSNSLDGLQMMIGPHEVHFRMSGLFNAYNLLAAYGVAVCCGLDAERALAVLSNLQGASGRFETLRSVKENILGIIDYAHTPDALKNVLSTIRQFDLSGKLITVIGCGGDRDKAKRPLMADVACEYSDTVVLTSDNPRSEDPEAILDDMEAELGLPQKRKVMRITDRRAAIKTACTLAQRDDVLLVAGKGHERYQEICGKRIHFDDKEVVMEMWELLQK